MPDKAAPQELVDLANILRRKISRHVASARSPINFEQPYSCNVAHRKADVYHARELAFYSRKWQSTLAHDAHPANEFTRLRITGA